MVEPVLYRSPLRSSRAGMIAPRTVDTVVDARTAVIQTLVDTRAAIVETLVDARTAGIEALVRNVAAILRHGRNRQ
jgi:hypothetical protein